MLSSPDYKWCIPSSNMYEIGTIIKYNTQSRYGSVDNKTVLDLEDDISHIEMGGKWRTPTADEWNELIDCCTWEWMPIEENGIRGRFMVTSKKDGFTDRYIILPLAGRYSTSGGSWNQGYIGLYWSSSLYTDNPWDAWRISFGYDHRSPSINRSERSDGMSIRPVTD